MPSTSSTEITASSQAATRSPWCTFRHPMAGRGSGTPFRWASEQASITYQTRTYHAYFLCVWCVRHACNTHCSHRHYVNITTLSRRHRFCFWKHRHNGLNSNERAMPLWKVRNLAKTDHNVRTHVQLLLITIRIDVIIRKGPWEISVMSAHPLSRRRNIIGNLLFSLTFIKALQGIQLAYLAKMHFNAYSKKKKLNNIVLSDHGTLS